MNRFEQGYDAQLETHSTRITNHGAWSAVINNQSADRENGR